MEVLDFTSKVNDNLLKVAESFRVDAVNREEAQKNEALAREQCHRQQAEWRENALRQDAEKREQNLLKDAALREERMQKEAQAQRSNAFAREEVLLRTRAAVSYTHLTLPTIYSV